MKIIYSGTLAEGVLKDPESGQYYEFKRGEAIEVPNKFGELALKSPDWKAAGKESK